MVALKKVKEQRTLNANEEKKGFERHWIRKEKWVIGFKLICLDAKVTPKIPPKSKEKVTRSVLWSV